MGGRATSVASLCLIYAGYAGAEVMLGRKLRSNVFYEQSGYRLSTGLHELAQHAFPALVRRPPGKPAPPKDPETWSPEALALSKSLLQRRVTAQDGRRHRAAPPVAGLRSALESPVVAQQRPGACIRRAHGSRARWASNDHTLVQFCNAKERGVFSLAFVLGRVRGAVEQELQIAAARA